MPAPPHRRTHVDGFGNTVTYLAVDAPHDHLEVTATSDVDWSPDRVPVPDGVWDGPWEDAAAGHRARAGVPTGCWRVRAASTRRSSSAGPSWRAFAATELIPGRAAGRGGVGLTRPHLRRVRVTMPRRHRRSAHRRAEDVLADRRGVCQDFAHLAIGCLALGSASRARYVSGYLEHRCPSRASRDLIGADASHAWVSLSRPRPVGWIDLDPTNGLRAARPARHGRVGPRLHRCGAGARGGLRPSPPSNS